MIKRLLLTLMCLLGTVALCQPRINPSGVWSWSDFITASFEEFSWGKNPLSIECDIIDLGANPPYIVVASEQFFVTSWEQDHFLINFFGYWGDDNTSGSISMVFGPDRESMHYLRIEPVYRSGLIDNGPNSWFKRIPPGTPKNPNTSVVFSPQNIRPSGVWDHPGVQMNSTREFSWGTNPVNKEVYTIDLGAEKPTIDFAGERLTIHEVVQKDYVFIFKGSWYDEDEPGSVSVIFSADGNSLYFLDVKPDRFHGLTDFLIPFWFVRVPQDAPVVPIGENGP
ncbi:MAG TPA: hypothetical protein VIO60_11780 [Rectinemataceae bacterium]